MQLEPVVREDHDLVDVGSCRCCEDEKTKANRYERIETRGSVATECKSESLEEANLSSGCKSNQTMISLMSAL